MGLETQVSQMSGCRSNPPTCEGNPVGAQSFRARERPPSRVSPCWTRSQGAVTSRHLSPVCVAACALGCEQGVGKNV